MAKQYDKWCGKTWIIMIMNREGNAGLTRESMKESSRRI